MIAAFLAPLLSRFDAIAAGCGHTFFGLVPWFQYLNVGDVTLSNGTVIHCQILSFKDGNILKTAAGGPSPLLLIAIAIIDDILRIAALVAVGFVIVGGFKYITSQGDSNATKNAQGTIVNALIGLIIAMFAAALVAFLGNRLGGP